MRQICGHFHIAEMSYELIPAVDHAEKLIRDAKDQPILNAAIASDVDIILTGNKDLLRLDMEHPKCIISRCSIMYSFP